jgi:hypothetical protein
MAKITFIAKINDMGKYKMIHIPSAFYEMLKGLKSDKVRVTLEGNNQEVNK